MSKFINLTGKRFKKLTVLERAISKRQPNGRLTTYWKCKCDCGRIIEVRVDRLRNEKVTCCNYCNKKNKYPNPKLYHMLKHMKERCYDVLNKQYKNYGARGIKICDEWLDKENGYNNFYDWAINNGFNKNATRYDCTIDRIDVNGNYEPSNCRFVSNYVQCRNKRNNIYIEYNNKIQILADWAKEFKIKPNIFRYRYLKGWSMEKIKNTPVRSRNGYKRCNSK